ncbi:hypothetical protein COLINT_03421 [Collinsella intestinalis DSM 13280]|uniref:Uncharacterized protein n=1 Tax=Collinsella intestinalis DSM 13280 TaxID=521003 RepID=C4FBG8_9ACTN|nr:hypothetical protein COLINT_03421 [Collinsella intestinalis DSM 13280]
MIPSSAPAHSPFPIDKAHLPKSSHRRFEKAQDGIEKQRAPQSELQPKTWTA